MRMLILAILVFVLAGVALGVTRLGLIERVPQLLASTGSGLTFEVTPGAEDDHSKVSIFRARPEGVLLLTAANRAQTARFQLPQDVAIAGGSLTLNATAQIADGQNSLLRVLVGNQIRGEVLLRPGQYDVEALIELTADDLASDMLGVRYALVLADDTGSCTPGGGLTNIVEIEQDTRVRLLVEDINLTPRDQVAAWGSVVLIGWPGWLSPEERQDRWMSAAQLTAQGYRVRFVDAPNSETLSGPDLADFVASQTPAYTMEEAIPAWPEYLSLAGANAGKRTFKEATSWRHWYRVGPHDHTSAPGAFRYELMLGPLPSTASWTIVVTHNGVILDVKEVAGRAGLHAGTVTLDDVEVLDSNLIEVTATSTYETVGQCNNGPDLFAEMRAETRLLPGGEVFEDELAAVSETVNQRQPLTVGFPDAMSLVEAQRMLDLTFDLIAPDTELVMADGPAILTAVRRSDVPTVAQSLRPSAFIVGLDENNRTRVARPAAFTDDHSDIVGGAVVLVIAPDVDDRLSMGPHE